MVPAPSRVSSGCFSALELARRLTVGVVERPGPAAGTPGPLRPRPPQLDPGPPTLLVAVLACDHGRVRWSPGGASLAERLGWCPGPLVVVSQGLWITLVVGEGADAPQRRVRPDAALLGDGRLWLGPLLRATVAASGRVLAAVADGRLALADPTTVVVAAGVLPTAIFHALEEVRP